MENGITASLYKDGIVPISELLKLDDLDEIERILKESYIHRIEIIIDWVRNKNYKDLFRLGVDESLPWLADAAISCELDGRPELEKELILTFWKDEGLNTEHLYFIENGERVELFGSACKRSVCVSYSRYETRYSYIQSYTLDEICTLLGKCRRTIMDDVRFTRNRDRNVAEFTPEYFDSRLTEGDVQWTVVTLCRLMESKLRCELHNETDLNELIDSYCVKKNAGDEIRTLLHRLRMERNNIMHDSLKTVDFSRAELEKAIDYICRRMA